MRKTINNTVRIIAVLFLMVSWSHCASAQDEEGVIPRIWKRFRAKKPSGQTAPLPSAVPEQKKIPAMTKEEMVRQIKDEIKTNEEILSGIPQIKKGKDKDGKEFYAYSKDGKEVNLEDLDEKKLKSLLKKVYTQVNACQAKMVAEQMEVAREAQRVSVIHQQMPRTPPPPPRPPQPPPRPPRR